MQQPPIISTTYQPEPPLILPPQQYSPQRQPEFTQQNYYQPPCIHQMMPTQYSPQRQPEFQSQSFYQPPRQYPPQIIHKQKSFEEPLHQPLRTITQIQNIPTPNETQQYPLDKEANYNFQISKMNEKIIEQKRNLAEQDRQLNDAKNQIEYLEHQIETFTSENTNYKETLKKMYMIYVQQQKQIEVLTNQILQLYNKQSKAAEIDLQQQNFSMNEKNCEFNMNIQNMMCDQDHMIHQYNQQNLIHQNEIKNMTTQLQDKAIETQELKRKINDLLDLKRRLEDETSSLRFTLDNQRATFELDCKERQVKFDQMNACVRDELNILRCERDDAFNRLQRLADDNKAQFEQIKFLEVELARARSHTGTYPMQSSQQYSMPPQQIEHSKRSPNLELSQQENDQLRNENERLKRQLEEMHKSELLKDDQIKSLSMNPDRKVVSFTPQDNVTATGKIDEEFMIYITRGLLELVTFKREAITNIIFEIYVRSINHANIKKQNSLILFILNLKELKEKYWKGLVLTLEAYERLRHLCRQLTSMQGISHRYPNFFNKLSLAVGKILNENVDFRDNINKWIEGTLASTIGKKIHEKHEKNRVLFLNFKFKQNSKEFLFLFRLLTIKYRIRYPLQGKSFNIDLDLDNFLENKICSSLRKVLKMDL